jgi:hypothetical protein
MDYHLCRNGQNVGVFPLEELRRRRGAGEVSGGDLVWCEGMTGWAPLDSVLGIKATRPLPPPIPDSVVRAKRKSDRVVFWAIVAAALVGITAITMVSVGMVKFFETFRQGFRRGLANSMSAKQVADKAIVAGTNSLTAETVRQRSREFRVRQYLEAYRKHGPHTAAWDSEADQLIESWIAANFGGPTNLPSPERLGDELAARSDCQDPIVLTVAASIAVELREKTRRLERAVAACDNSPYPAYPKLYATVSLASELGSRSSRVRTLDQKAMEYFRQAFADGSLQPGDEEELAEILVNGWGHNFLGRNGPALCQTVRDAKGYPWLALVLEGDCEITEAWRARGSGWSDSVSSQGWQGFSQHLARGRTVLTRAWKLHPDRPLAPARMIVVAMGENGAAEMRTWFDRATRAQIDYPTAWSNFRWGLRPRWYGSYEALIALGIRAVDTKRFDTDVPRKLFDCVSDVEADTELQAGEHLYGRPDIWPHLKQMYEGYVAEPSQEHYQSGWRSSYAAVAYLAGDYKAARQQLEALDWKPVTEKLAGWGSDLSLMPLHVAALTGSSAAKVSEAESRCGEERLPEAIRIYGELNASAETDERTRQFSLARLAALQEEQRLAKGEWIDLLPANQSDPNWNLENDKLRWLPDGAVEVESGHRGHGFYSRTRMGAEFEVTGQFELVRTTSEDYQAGLLIGLPDGGSSTWFGFRMKQNAAEGQVASFSRGWTTRQVLCPATLNRDGTNTFRFRLRQGKADAWVNGVEVLRQAAPESKLGLSSDSLLGLGAYNDMNETVIRYRAVKARRILPGE